VKAVYIRKGAELIVSGVPGHDDRDVVLTVDPHYAPVIRFNVELEGNTRIEVQMNADDAHALKDHFWDAALAAEQAEAD
jgi:hypothetical protein